ncbi:MAG: MFS transporter, partial [Blastocatellia bacterium]
WSAAQAGVVYGLLTSIIGVLGILAGGRVADWLAERGYRDANLRFGLIVTLAWLPTGLLFPLMPNAGWAVALLIPTYFLVSAPWGAAAAALQQVMPNSMRGQATGIYLFALNLIGGGLGPTAVALVTDYVFHDDYALKYSLVIIGAISHLASAVLLWRGLKHFRASLDRLQVWTAANG